MERGSIEMAIYARKPAINYRGRALAASINTHPALPACTFTHRHLKIDHRRYAYVYIYIYMELIVGGRRTRREYVYIYICSNFCGANQFIRLFFPPFYFIPAPLIDDTSNAYIIFVYNIWRWCVFLFYFCFIFFPSFLEWKILIGSIDKRVNVSCTCVYY